MALRRRTSGGSRGCPASAERAGGRRRSPRSRRGPSCSCPPTPVRVPCPEATGIPQVASAADQAVTVLLRTCLPVWLRRCLGSRPPLPSHPCTRNLQAVDRGGGDRKSTRLNSSHV